MNEPVDPETLRADALAAIDNAADLATLDEVRVRFLGKKGALTSVLRTLGHVPRRSGHASGRRPTS